MRILLRSTFLPALLLLSNSTFAAPSESDRFNRLYGGYQLVYAEETQMRVPMALTGLIVGPAVLAIGFADYRVGAPNIVCAAVGGGLIGMGVGSLLFSGPISRIQTKLDEAQGQGAKLAVLEDTLKSAAEMSRAARKAGTWLSAVMTPVSAALAIDQYSRGSGGATGWLIASTAFLSMGISSLISETHFEKLWNDYRDWSGGSAKTSSLQLKPSLGLVSLNKSPSLSAGISLAF